jgi:hypothetical protein
MKFDMGGSAATFGAAKAIAQIKPPGVEVIIFPAKLVGINIVNFTFVLIIPILFSGSFYCRSM